MIKTPLLISILTSISALIFVSQAMAQGDELPLQVQQIVATDGPTEQIYVTAGDSLPKKKDNFFRRFYRYFDESNEDKTLTKRFDISLIGGPSYSSDTKFGLGMVAGGQFRTDRHDSITQPSNVSVWGSVSTTGFYLVGIMGNTFWKQKRHRLDYTMYFYSMPTYYWGLGYADGANVTNPTKYLKQQAQLRADYLYGFVRNTYVGVTLSLNYIAGSKFKSEPDVRGQDLRYFSSGPGALFIYDSRDAVTEAHRGSYVRAEGRAYPSIINRMPFNSVDIIADHYHRLWRGAVLAYDFHAAFTFGDTPWTMMPSLGGSYRMRGYYKGQYTDKMAMEFQVEYRQKIYNRHGVVAWGGVGNVFPSFGNFKAKQTLPNYGLGYRWEFKKRMNVRIDYGWGKGCSAFIFGINEAF